MKKHLLTTAAVALAFFAFSQSNKKRSTTNKQCPAKDKEAMAAEFIQLSRSTCGLATHPKMSDSTKQIKSTLIGLTLF